MDIVKLLQDHSVPFWTEGNNVGPGWIQMKCCHCYDTSNHLGYNLKSDYFFCWRCGYHGTAQTLYKMLQLSGYGAAQQIIADYGGKSLVKQKQVELSKKAFKLPSNVSPLLKRHRKYLIRRNYDPDELVHDWGIMSTGSFSFLDGINYSHRILAPITWNGQVASFQTRDTTEQHTRKYLACPQEREVHHHKHILYGNQPKWKDYAIVVEGITDVWRLGPIAVATFGIKFTGQQWTEISKHFKRVMVLFDNEVRAQRQAREMEKNLSLLGVHVGIEVIEDDPGSLSQQDARHLVRSFVRTCKIV